MKHIYTHKDFDDLVAEFLNREQQLMQWKTGEYASEKDRLLNFHQVGELMGRPPAEIVLAYLLKHIQSITLAVMAGKFKWTWEEDGKEGLKQRIADARNYLLLLAACLDEEERKNEHSTM